MYPILRPQGNPGRASVQCNFFFLFFKSDKKKVFVDPMADVQSCKTLDDRYIVDQIAKTAS